MKSMTVGSAALRSDVYAETMENAVIYPRYSSTGQNEQTIETQIQLCKDYAEKHNLRVVKVFDGDKAKSASKEIEKRKDLHKMLAAAESRTFKYIIVYELNRFMRNRAESVLFKSQLEKYGVRVLSVCENITDDEGGELYEMILEWRDEKYSRDLSRRVKHGLDTSAANGTFCGGYLIYGYKKHKEPIAGKNERYIKTVAIDEAQATLVRYAFEEYDKGVEKKDIAAALNAQGHRYKGKPFTGKTFDRWLVNVKYTGEFYFGSRLCDNMYPPIIDRALFQRVQERLDRNKYFAGGAATARIPYLLTGKAVCLHCETDMVAGGGVSHTGKGYHYYDCKRMKKHTCDKRREYKDVAERYTTDCVRDFLSDIENIEIAVTDTMNYFEKRTGEESIKSLEKKIANVQVEVEELADGFVKAKSGLLQKTIEKKMKDYEALLDSLLTQKAKLVLERGYKLTKQEIFDFISDLLQGDPADKEYQKKIIDNLVDKVYIGDNETIVTLKIRGNNKIKTEIINFSEIKNAATKAKTFGTRLLPLRQ
jgi:DNA invertase Pin-like site-specific DNA recombinase